MPNMDDDTVSCKYQSPWLNFRFPFTKCGFPTTLLYLFALESGHHGSSPKMAFSGFTAKRKEEETNQKTKKMNIIQSIVGENSAV